MSKIISAARGNNGPMQARIAALALVALLASTHGAVFAEPGDSAQATAVAAEPEFKPGIPGLKMVDVRDHKFLFREIDELQRWEQANRISIAEFRTKAIEKTVQYLQLSGAQADNFTATATGAIGSVRESFKKTRPRGGDPNAPFSVELRTAVARIGGALQDQPRHLLFEPESKKWLLKLAFGPKESKEAKQAKQAQADAAGG